MEDQPTPMRYDIHVRGVLSDRLLSAFPELRARIRNHETVLSGALPDQAALHGALARIEALGLELLEVRRATSKPIMSTEGDHPIMSTEGDHPIATDHQHGKSAESDNDASSPTHGE